MIPPQDDRVYRGDKEEKPMVNSNGSTPVWLTIPEAAEVMRLGRNKLYQLVAEGVIPHRRLGRSIHIHRDVAELWTPEESERLLAGPRVRG